MSGGFYQVWPPSISGSGGGSGVNSIGSLDSQAASVNGASISGSVLYMQSASSASGGAGVGLVNTVQQAFLGNKVFVNQVLHSDGTSALPGMGFFSQPGIGWYRIGSADVGLSLGGAIALEMLLVGSQTNFGFGAAASGALTNPLAAQANYNGTTYFQYNNFNTGSASATILQALSGTNANNYINLENYNNLLSGYLAGGSAVFSGPFQSQLNIGNESTSVNTYIAFNLNGRTLATEKVRLNVSNLTLNGGMQFIMTGSSSGAPTLTQQAAISGTGYAIIWPGSAGSNSQPLIYGVGGALAWASTTGSGSFVLASAPTLLNPVVGTQAQLDGSTKAASTSYVDTAVANAIAGVNPAIAVQAATVGSGDTNALTYNNGVSGIGATFTGTTNTPIVVDGYTFTGLNQRLLVKNDTQSANPGAYNGIYYVTTIQTVAVPPVLTRALDYDQSTDINNTGAIPVINGNANATTQWLLINSVSVVGTSPLVYTKFTSNPNQAVSGSVSQTSSSGGNAYAISWPGTQGSSSSSTLVNLGAGQMAWYPNAGSTIQTFSSGSGVYTPRPGVIAIKITCVGGGGGGGGAALTSGSSSSAGGGGGGGSTAIKWLATSSLSTFASFSYYVGSGGVGGQNGVSAPTTGTSSLFGAIVVALGGFTGSTSAAVNQGYLVAGGAGGSAGVGDLVFRGLSGGTAITFPNAGGFLPMGVAGFGGGTYLSGGTPTAPGYTPVTQAGTGGTLYGGGGAGGLNCGSGGMSASATGGGGAVGCIIVEEFYY